MDNIKTYDTTIIGSGPGGYVAAIRASQLGQKVCVLEKNNIGGVCLNWGCVPTKSLLKSAEILNMIKNSKEYGIFTENINVNIKTIINKSRNVVNKLGDGIKKLFKKYNIDIIYGNAQLINSYTVKIENSIIHSKNIIVATGASLNKLNDFSYDSDKIWTAKEALLPDEVPKSIIIIGGGSIGIEFATFYNILGSKVTIIELAESILPLEDQEISKIAESILKRNGIKIFNNTKVLDYNTDANNINLTINTNNIIQKLKSEKLLIAIGVKSNINNLGLENTKILTNNRHIIVNEFQKTNENNIWAIGDVAGGPYLAHKASKEGIIAAENISKMNTYKICKQRIPNCTFSIPQIASVGLTEKQAIENGYEIKVGKFVYNANSKALIINETDGIIKTIFEKHTSELLGAHIIGSEATEIIHALVAAINMECTEIDLMNMIFAHPTLSEGIQESVLNAYDISIHN